MVSSHQHGYAWHLLGLPSQHEETQPQLSVRSPRTCKSVSAPHVPFCRATQSHKIDSSITLHTRIILSLSQWDSTAFSIKRQRTGTWAWDIASSSIIISVWGPITTLGEQPPFHRWNEKHDSLYLMLYMSRQALMFPWMYLKIIIILLEQSYSHHKYSSIWINVKPLQNQLS